MNGGKQKLSKHSDDHHVQQMCDIQCIAGLCITFSVVGVIMTIICCKLLCSIMLQPIQPAVARMVVGTEMPTVIEMPILIRIYLPQQQQQQQQQQRVVEQEATRKNAFEPLPVFELVPL